MKNSPWSYPALGTGTAVLTLAVAYLVLRFAPSPVEIATLVVTVLLVALAAIGYLATQRGHAATFVAIALVMPYLLVGTVLYAGAQRASSEIESIFEEEPGFDEDFLDEEEPFHDEEPLGEEGGTYGSDPALDALQDDCVAGDQVACDDLYFQSPAGSEYESTALRYGGGTS